MHSKFNIHFGVLGVFDFSWFLQVQNSLVDHHSRLEVAVGSLANIVQNIFRQRADPFIDIIVLKQKATCKLKLKTKLPEGGSIPSIS